MYLMDLLGRWFASIAVRRHGQRGQVLPLVAFALVPLIALAALAIDAGIWRYEQQLAQLAADSAAVAAAVEIENAGSLGAYTVANIAVPAYMAANIDATANGFPGGSASGVLNAAQGVTLTLNNPPASGLSTTNTQAVEVIVQKKLPTFFGPATFTVSARSVAIAQSNCLVALDSLDEVAMDIFRGSLNMPNCGVMSNGQLAMSDSGITPEPVIYAKTLGYRYWVSYWFGITNGAWPNARRNAIPDPCSTISGCAYLTNSPPSPQGCYAGTATTIINAPAILLPGTYCNTTFSGSGYIAVTPGLYYFAGGLTSTAGVSFQGYNVTMYLTGPMNLNASTVDLLATTSGPYANVLIYQASTGAVNFNNSGNSTLTGLIYAPQSWVSICGDISTCNRNKPAGGATGTTIALSSIVGWKININTLNKMNFSGLNDSSGNGVSE